MKNNLVVANDGIERKNKQFLFSFLFLVVGILLVNIVLFYFLDFTIICIINSLGIFCLYTGYIISSKLGLRIQTINNLSLLFLCILVFSVSIIIGKQFPIIYRWYLAFAIASFMIQSFKSAVYWALLGVFLTLFSIYIGNNYDTYVYKVFSPEDIKTIIYTNIGSFIILFIILLYFLNEFQKLKIRKVALNNSSDAQEEKEEVINDTSTNSSESKEEKEEVINDINTDIIETDTSKNDEPLNSEKLEELYAEIKRYFIENKAHLDSGFNGYRLAFDLNVHLSSITKAITYKNGSTLKALTNYYRIKEVKEKLKAREHEKFTLKHIYSSVGFSSQSTFNRAFKEVEGITPSQYIEQLT